MLLAPAWQERSGSEGEGRAGRELQVLLGPGRAESCVVGSCVGPELPDLKLWRLRGFRVSMSAERVSLSKHERGVCVCVCAQLTQ